MKYLIKRIKSRTGSSTIMLSMAFAAFAICIASAIVISRQMVLNSECEAFGRVWARAVLSEYDKHLLEDYGMMAYFGNEAEVTNKIESYVSYSLKDRMNSSIDDVDSVLVGFELSDPNNFRKAIQQGLGNTVDAVLNDKARKMKKTNNAEESANGDTSNESNRIIRNQLVIDTLPSVGKHNSSSIDTLTNLIQKYTTPSKIKDGIINTSSEIVFMYMYFDNNVTKSCYPKSSWFSNEWEYVLEGKLDDEENYKSIRRKLFLLRNALNLAALYKDQVKVEAIATISELLTPGPPAILTQILLSEVWAGLEAEADIIDLYNNRRVPILKSDGDWKISLENVIDSDEVTRELDKDAISNMEENQTEIDSIKREAANSALPNVLTEGLNYDEHLLVMILSMNDDVRLHRIMDIVQINMKHRYYRDFNLMEYYTGVRFNLILNGRSHLFEDKYK